MSSIFDTFIPAAAEERISIFRTGRFISSILPCNPIEVSGIISPSEMEAELLATKEYGSDEKPDYAAAWRDLKGMLPFGRTVFAFKMALETRHNPVEIAIIKAPDMERFTLAFQEPDRPWYLVDMRFAIGEGETIYDFLASQSDYRIGHRQSDSEEASLSLFLTALPVLLWTLYLIKHQEVVTEKGSSIGIGRYNITESELSNLIPRLRVIDLTKLRLECATIALESRSTCGTGISRCPHDRHGHFRTMKKSGKIVHVRPSKIRGGSEACIPRTTVYKIMPDQPPACPNFP